MFIGHYAPAMLAATLPRAPRLWVLVLAAQAADIVFALLTLAGVEHYAVRPGLTPVSPFDFYVVPWSHSLLGSLGIAGAVALLIRLATSDKTAAWIAGLVAASHWPLDWLVHLPDLTIAGGGDLHGLGLWNRPLVALPLELGLFGVAAVAYANRTRANGPRGAATLAWLVGACVSIQLALWIGQPRIAADPAPGNLAWSNISVCVAITVFAWWCDLTRVRRRGSG